MKLWARIAWGTAAVLAVGAVVGVTLGAAHKGGNAVVDTTLAFTIVAALAALAGAVITWLGNRASAAHQRELSEKQGQMAEDIRRLAELTESSIEEARAQRPEPVVFFLIGRDGTTSETAVLERRRSVREIDVGAIVAREKQLALASLPAARPETTRETSPAAGWAGSLSEQLASIGRFAEMVRGTGPLTEEERAEFTRRAETYGDDLRDWLEEYRQWRDEMQEIAALRLRFENRGRVPARDVHVQLRFPDGFEQVDELPQLDGRPTRPRFKRRTPTDLFVRVPEINLLGSDFARRIPNIAPPGNVSGPRYRRGSLLAEIHIGKLLHGVPEETDEPLTLRVAEDGDYTIPWEIHAENLAEPANGELRLRIVTNEETGPPVTALEELLPPESAENDDEDE
jgi:hypothetical protein